MATKRGHIDVAPNGQTNALRSADESYGHPEKPIELITPATSAPKPRLHLVFRQARSAKNMNIVENDPTYFSDLIRLNEIWISEYFQIEEVDRELARDPSVIIRNGGHVFSATIDNVAVGTAALFYVSPVEFELARMAVSPEHRGHGIGRALAVSAINKAKLIGATRMTLLSNTRLTAAVALYWSLGFEVLREGQHPDYQRCNIVMRKVLNKSA